MDQQPKSARLTLESVRELLKNEEPEVVISSLDEEPGSGRGDNYCSMLYRALVKGRKAQKNGESRPWERAIIYKILPESRERRDAFKCEALFRNEMAFYTHVWPALNKLQSQGKRVFGGVAKILVARADLIAMEDLKEKGFTMIDRKIGLEFESLKIVLKALAGFHALSLTLKELRPDDFERLTKPGSEEAVQEALFNLENENWYRQYYRVAINNAIKMVSDDLPAIMEPRRDEIMGKLRAFLNEDVFFRTMCELTVAESPLTIICHGDCWTNNILFRGENSTDPEEVYLVDFQLSRVGSLALDLVYLLYCCTSGEVRRTHMVHLLEHYHSHLLSALHTLNPSNTKDSKLFWTLLNDEMRRCGRFGLGLAIDMLPISTCASEQAPDLYEGEESNRGETTTRSPPLGGAKCAKLMTDLVLELIQNNAL